MKSLLQKSTFLLFCFTAQLFWGTTTVLGNTPNPDAIVGLWKPGSGNGLVQIYKQGNNYFGKIVWLKTPIDPTTGKPQTDVKNKEPKLRSRPILGLVNVKDLKFIKEYSWKEGSVYDPNSGNEYSCKITMIDENTIELRGFIGFSIIGRTDTWKRQKSL